MSLRWYRIPRLVVLSPSSPVLEAARAIESNNIGAVVVQNDGQIVGMVTDREALRAETAAWHKRINDRQRGVDWQMRVEDARIKLKSVYPKNINVTLH